MLSDLLNISKYEKTVTWDIGQKVKKSKSNANSLTVLVLIKTVTKIKSLFDFINDIMNLKTFGVVHVSFNKGSKDNDNFKNFV